MALDAGTKVSDLEENISAEPIAGEFEYASRGLFTITFLSRVDVLGSRLLSLFVKPSNRIKQSFQVDRELLVVGSTFPTVQPRTIKAARHIIDQSTPRLSPTLAILIHSDQSPGAGDSLRSWGRESNLSVIAICRPSEGLHISPDQLERLIARDLYASDPFDLSGAVVDDREFFGRKDEALAIGRSLEAGQNVTLFAIRKVGKTSVLDRVAKVSREQRTLACAVVDCSREDIWRSSAAEVVSIMRNTLASALTSPDCYAVAGERSGKTCDSDEALMDIMKKAKRPAALLLDEADYVTPSSPTHSDHWRKQFIKLWRDLRIMYQESSRSGNKLGMLVCGVSSKWFKTEAIDGVENAAVAFLPEKYLRPFAPGASEPMLKDLGRRCGLLLEPAGAKHIARVCGNFPYWMRKAGSFLHRNLSKDERPMKVPFDLTVQLLDAFVKAEGAEIASTSLKHFVRHFPEVEAELKSMVANQPPSRPELRRLLESYGLISPDEPDNFGMPLVVREGLRHAFEPPLLELSPASAQLSERKLTLSEGEWAEEMGLIAKRRSIIELRLRSFLIPTLWNGFAGKPGQTVQKAILASLNDRRKSELEGLDSYALAEKLTFLELSTVIARNWPFFERVFGDKDLFRQSVNIVNRRQDAHAKAADLAEIALMRQHLEWFEDKLHF